MRGYEIMELNWRRPRSEVDIVAQKNGVIYFVEVKYRRTAAQGSGLDYITASKLERMRRGAADWVDEVKWTGEYQLAAVEVAGADFVVEHFIEDIM